jgi:hypothetical protein
VSSNIICFWRVIYDSWAEDGFRRLSGQVVEVQRMLTSLVQRVQPVTVSK